MYLLHIRYSQPLARVEPLQAEHGAWVKAHIENGNFVFAGPKKSGLGGVILARSLPKPALRELIATDVYVREDVADYDVVEFDIRLAAAGFEALRDA